MPRIVLEGVSKSFAGTEGKSITAVDALTLEVKDRELLALVGPSGCGKTTTLRLIAGLETPEAGKIRFDERLVTTLPPIDRDVAMVFQSHALFPHFTAFDNLAFGLRLRHVAKVEINSRVCEIAEMLGLTPVLDRKPGKLSGGERQRVALGRALVRRPKILLLDEPFSHLDEPLRVQMRSELLSLRSRLDLTVLYVTHDQAEALALGDRVAVLRSGSLQQVGSPQEVFAAPANSFVAGFIGSSAMNLVRMTVARIEEGLVLLDAANPSDASQRAFVLPLSDWRMDWFSQNVGRPILLGIRPENISLSHDTGCAGATQPTTALVQSTQFTGAETILHLGLGSINLRARIGSLAGFQSGQAVTLAFDLKGARVYDGISGALLF
jgi:multiple sugar transport system ATP-binding protein